MSYGAPCPRYVGASCIHNQACWGSCVELDYDREKEAEVRRRIEELARPSPDEPDNDGWISTFTGRKFWPLAPRAEDVDIMDIAHALAMRCRYGGHSREFYSVAQHSVLVSWAVKPAFALKALLHDGEEAYSPFGDIPRPVKNVLRRKAPMVLAINERIQAAICERFGLSPEEPQEIKDADTAILGDEMTVLMPDTDGCGAKKRWGSLDITIEPWPWLKAYDAFMDRFKELEKLRQSKQAAQP